MFQHTNNFVSSKYNLNVLFGIIEELMGKITLQPPRPTEEKNGNICIGWDVAQQNI